jgi:serine phosphatase RsbU (regulator of sigma subunit)
LERSVHIIEQLRTVAGGDLMADVERSVRFSQVAAGLERPIVASVTATAHAEVYIGMIPKIGASADFAEVVCTSSRLWLAIGDVPASGLKSAFAARFVANLFRKLAASAPEGSVAHLLDEIRRTIQPAAYFDRISMQCVEIDLTAGRLRLANAGHPAPVLYSAKRRTSDQLIVVGPLFDKETLTTAYRARSAEISEGDILVLVSDGLTEGGRLNDPYGYRFMSILERDPSATAQTIGERILDDWRAHPRAPGWLDDVTIVVAILGSEV